MKYRITFFAAAIVAITTVRGVMAQPAEADPGVLAHLKNNCLACHGAIKDDRKVIKGSFDFTDLLTGEIDPRHSARWALVAEMIRERAMPPDDSDYQLSDSERKEIINTVYARLDRKAIPYRVMTAREIANTTAELFEFNLGAYDPFSKLAFVKLPDARYDTTDSRHLMGGAFMRELDQALNRTFADLLEGGLAKQAISADTSHELYFNLNDKLLRAPIYHAHLEIAEARFERAYHQGQVKKKKRTGNGLEEAQRKLAEVSARLTRLQKATKEDRSPGILDLRTRKPDELRANGERPIPAGSWRIRFSANALNRHVVAREYALDPTVPNRSPWEKRWHWEELVHDKARLQLQLRAWEQSGVKDRKFEVQGTPLQTIEIEDNREQEYEFTIHSKQPFRLLLVWENGPFCAVRKLQKFSLGTIGPQKRKGMDYELPCIRITSEIVLEPIGKQTAPFILAANASEATARQQLSAVIEKLYLNAHRDELLANFDRFLKVESFDQAYLDAFKWILMSKQNLYLRLDENDLESSARFASYSLLKHPPTEAFKKQFRDFRSSRITPREFADHIIASRSFDDFLDTLVDGWLEQWAELDNRKFDPIERQVPFDEETITWLTHGFRENRPAAVLFASDYRIINGPLAAFYRLNDRPFTDKFERVSTPGRGGLLHQGKFYVAQSDGIDPRPFSRAKWIVENVFGKHISEPPGDINSDQFFASEKELTFKQRTEMHSKNAVCASCHKTIDPVAFSMNNFDTLGRPVGEQDEAANRELAERLKHASEPMARSVTRHLISCIIGREANIYDTRVVDQIIAKTKHDGHRAGDILALILDEYFGK